MAHMMFEGRGLGFTAWEAGKDGSPVGSKSDLQTHPKP